MGKQLSDANNNRQLGHFGDVSQQQHTDYHRWKLTLLYRPEEIPKTPKHAETAETTETFSSMQSQAETPTTTHKHANSFSELSHEVHESAEGIYLSKICPSMPRNILLLTTEVVALTN